jgi:hypothetical protein
VQRTFNLFEHFKRLIIIIKTSSILIILGTFLLFDYFHDQTHKVPHTKFVEHVCFGRVEIGTAGASKWQPEINGFKGDTTIADFKLFEDAHLVGQVITI